jgi:hypothetical protein
VIQVLDNDSDLESSGALSVSNLTQPAHGTAQLNADGTVAYTAAFGFEGADAFTYTPNDGVDDGNLVTVAVNVTDPSLFSDGFESGTLESWDTAVVESGNTLTVDAESALAGSLGLHIVTDGGNDDGRIGKEIAPSGEVFFAIQIELVDNVGTDGGYRGILTAETGPDGPVIVAGWRSRAGSYTNRLFMFADGDWIDTGVELSVGTPYCLELHVVAGAGSGEATLFLDGVPLAEATGLTMGSSITGVQLGPDFSGLITDVCRFVPRGRRAHGLLSTAGTSLGPLPVDEGASWAGARRQAHHLIGRMAGRGGWRPPPCKGRTPPQAYAIDKAKSPWAVKPEPLPHHHGRLTRREVPI